MRAALVSSFIVIAACAGSKKPAEQPESPGSETSSSGSTDNTSESDSGAAEAPAASAPAAPAEAPAEAAPAPSPASPAPTVTGTIDGKAFAPKMARVIRVQKDGRVVVVLDERTDCGAGDPKPGEAVMTITVTLEDGYKVDLGSLKRGGKKGEISFVRVSGGGKKDYSTTFKPTGRVTVVHAPMEQNAVGKLNLDLTSGDYMLSGDLDLQACVAPKSAAKAGAKKKK